MHFSGVCLRLRRSSFLVYRIEDGAWGWFDKSSPSVLFTKIFNLICLMGYQHSYSLKTRIFFSRKRFIGTTYFSWNSSSAPLAEGSYFGHPIFSPSKSHFCFRRASFFLRKRSESRSAWFFFAFGHRLFSFSSSISKYPIACGQPFYFSSYVGGLLTNWRNVLRHRLHGISRLPSSALVFDPFRFGNILSESSLLGIPSISPVGFKVGFLNASYPLPVPVNPHRAVVMASILSKSIISGRRRRGYLVPLSVCYHFLPFLFFIELTLAKKEKAAMPRIPYRLFVRRNKADPWYKTLSSVLKNPPRHYRNFRVLFHSFMERHRKNFRALRYGFFRRLVRGFTFHTFQRERPTRITRYRLALRSRISFKRFFYPMGEKQLRRTVSSLRVFPGLRRSKLSTFYILFESRLVSVVLRSRFMLSPLLVRQEIFHGRIYVNGLPIFHPNHRLVAGDIVTFPRTMSMKIRSHFFNFFHHCRFFGRFKNHLLSVPSHLSLCYSLPFIQFLGFFYGLSGKYPVFVKQIIPT